VGVRPTIYADARKWENYPALPLRSRLRIGFGAGPRGRPVKGAVGVVIS
jgi:hypothetical protein